MAYGYDPRGKLSPMEQIRARLGARSGDTLVPESQYPLFVDTINPVSYGSRLRHQELLRNIEESRRARVSSHFGWHSRITDTVIPSVLLARQRIESDRVLSASRATSQYAINTRFGIGGTRKSARESAEILNQLFEEGASGSSSGTKKMSDTISRGIQTAFGGKELTGLARALGMSRGLMGAWGLVYALRKYFGTAITAARQGAQIGWSAEFTGTTPTAMAGTTGAVSAFGGGIGSAVRLYSLINAVKQGTLVGKPNPWAAAIKQYGLNLASGSLEGGGWKSEEGIIKEISNKMASLNTRAAADLAQSLGLDQSMFMLLRDGYDRYKSRVAYANEGSPFANERAMMVFEHLTESTNLLSNEFDKLKANLASTNVADEIITFWKDVLHSLNKSLVEGEKSQAEIDKEEKKNLAMAAMAVSAQQAGYGDWYEGSEWIPGLNRREPQIKKFFERIRLTKQGEFLRSYFGGEWAKNYDYYKKLHEQEQRERNILWKNLDTNPFINPMRYNFPSSDSTAPQINNTVSLNLGDIRLKSGGEDTIREAVVASIDWGFVPTAIARV